MVCIFNEEIFKRHREKAITDVSQLEVGKTYYFNHLNDGLKLIALQTSKEHYESNGLSWSDGHPDNIAWMVFEGDNPAWCRTHSLADNNIGNSYNPWLMFATKEDRDACVAELEVQIVSEGW